MAIIRINSNEDKENLIYESVSISYGKNEEKVFSSGNFVKDWFDVNRFLTLELNEPYVSFSSSVDHFIMDGAPYDNAYLNFDKDEKPYLSYVYDIYDDNIGNNIGIEFFVPEGTKPTWEELKEMCK
ncbi:hypothetical protein M0Q97_07740 [Candidatus Dojkabacteria bacterium]|jgi:hypothetical protein|nr:hypothetical protein [Candidatus Dojkabacteria bacterium]